MMESDIRPLEVKAYFSDEPLRVPQRFGAETVNSARMCHVSVLVENRRGDQAVGWGAVVLSDVWAWRDASIDPGDRQAAMADMVDAWGRHVCKASEYTHPVDFFWDMRGDLPGVAADVLKHCGLDATMPALAQLVCASPVDGAMHDAFGVVNEISTYAGYGPKYMQSDLSRFLGPKVAGKFIGDYIIPLSPWLDVFHLVAIDDKLTEEELGPYDVKDGWPATLAGWIEADGVRCFKVQMDGRDMKADLARLLAVPRVIRQTQKQLGIDEMALTLDVDGRCESPAYMTELLKKFHENDADGFDSILYCEQPCDAALGTDQHDVRELAEMVPVIIDESLVGLDAMDDAISLGYSGVALKAAKCQSLQLLAAAKATREKMIYTVQDLSSPGIAMLQSVGLAGHLSVLRGLEANARQFLPRTSDPESWVHPGIFRIEDGKIHTRTLRGVGMGYFWDKVGRRFNVPTPGQQ